MKRFALIALLTTGLLSCGGPNNNVITNATNPSEKSSANKFAVVELYTSEGCTSCPAAEALMPKLKNMYKDQLYLLEFHVDYWDRNGWKDPYSNIAFSNRQQKYADFFSKSGSLVYTPQAIVNGKSGINGSNEASLKSLINTELQQKDNKDISLTVNDINKNNITISYNAPLDAKEVLNIALVQTDITTNVKGGENEGKKLQHMNVVRSFQTLKDKSGSLNLTLPDNLPAKDFQIIAYMQNTSDFRVSGAKQIDVRKEAVTKN